MASVEAQKSELKQEGVIDTAVDLAQDSQSKVNPETVEERLVKETQEAGVPAYQFDPDATPEQKAEAAKAVCNPTAISQRGQRGQDVDHRK